MYCLGFLILVSSLEKPVELLQINDQSIANSHLQELKNNDLQSFLNEVKEQSNKHISKRNGILLAQ